MDNPTFSVIIPTLNEELFIPHLLDSLVSQTSKDFEVIVVDGSSKDKTVEVVKQYTKRLPRLRVVVSKKARLPLQRNMGAKIARGAWFLFVDADSVLMPYFIERCSVFVKEKRPQVFTSWFLPDSDKPNDAILTLLGLMMVLEGSLLAKRHIMTPGPFTAIAKDVFQDVKGYDVKHEFNEDIDIGLRLYKKGVKYAILRETLYVWSARRFRSQGTLKVVQQYTRAALQILVFRKALNRMPGYVMGGQEYRGLPKKLSPRTLKSYEKKLKRLIKELFD